MAAARWRSSRGEQECRCARTSHYAALIVDSVRHGRAGVDVQSGEHSVRLTNEVGDVASTVHADAHRRPVRDCDCQFGAHVLDQTTCSPRGKGPEGYSRGIDTPRQGSPGPGRSMQPRLPRDWITPVRPVGVKGRQICSGCRGGTCRKPNLPLARACGGQHLCAVAADGE